VVRSEASLLPRCAATRKHAINNNNNNNNLEESDRWIPEKGTGPPHEATELEFFGLESLSLFLRLLAESRSICSSVRFPDRVLLDVIIIAVGRFRPAVALLFKRSM
jgi:hypothetical protein